MKMKTVDAIPIDWIRSYIDSNPDGRINLAAIIAMVDQWRRESAVERKEQ